ncbi:Fc.00g113270.m01.CDS01 [Cosmosporella sp. VM-42]
MSSTPTPKSSMSQVRPEAYRPSMDDDESPLIHSRGEHDNDKPFFKVTFSTVKIIRFLTIPLGIADCRYVSHSRRRGGMCGFFTFWIVAMMTWNIFQLVKSFTSHMKKKGHFEVHLGNFTFSYGSASNQTQVFAAPKKWNYLINVVDFVFCILMIIISVVSFEVYWKWGYGVFEKVRGFSVTLAALQGLVALLGLFSLFRKVRICVYTAEGDDEKAAYRTPGLYHDEPECSPAPPVATV